MFRGPATVFKFAKTFQKVSIPFIFSPRFLRFGRRFRLGTQRNRPTLWLTALHWRTLSRKVLLEQLPRLIAKRRVIFAAYLQMKPAERKER